MRMKIEMNIKEDEGRHEVKMRIEMKMKTEADEGKLAKLGYHRVRAILDNIQIRPSDLTGNSQRLHSQRLPTTSISNYARVGG